MVPVDWGDFWSFDITCAGFYRVTAQSRPKQVEVLCGSVFKACKVHTLTSECYKKAGTATADALSTFAEHVSDGEYTKAELDEDIDMIEACISLWKEAPKCEKEL